ncbi:hypothetical protein EYR36_002392 [Pleurotus pulmonarius]|nr:hypothetical protein EYR36_002392 [Pleurotus pulmonarius]
MSKPFFFLCWNQPSYTEMCVKADPQLLVSEFRDDFIGKFNSHFGLSSAPGQLQVYKFKKEARISLETPPPYTFPAVLDEIADYLPGGTELSSLLPRLQEQDKYYHGIIFVNSTSQPTTNNTEEQDALTKLRSVYDTTIAQSRISETPSELSKPANYRQNQANPETLLLDGRYHSLDAENTVAPPVELYNPAFSQFLTDVADPTLEVPGELIPKVAKLMDLASAIYGGQETRRRILQGPLNDVLDCALERASNSDNTAPYPSGSQVLVNVVGRPTVICIGEIDSEFGEGSTDVTTQVSFSMQRTWSLPERLIDLVWLGVSTSFEEQRCLRVSKLFHCLARALCRLRDWYHTELPTFPLTATPSHPRFFPSVTSYFGASGEVLFRYVRPLKRYNACVVFLAEIVQPSKYNGQLIVVKFAARYCAEAHELLALADMAPKLLHCGQALPGRTGLLLVAMEYLSGVTAHCLTLEEWRSYDINSNVRKIVNVLHNKGFVFGDLRPQNLMYVNGSFKLIDFDWAGKEGEPRYPPFVSTGIHCPPGVRPCALITREHDMECLRRLG